MLICGYIEIEKGLVLTADCLGKSFDIKINGLNGKILTPILPDENDKNEEIFISKLIQPDCSVNFPFSDLNWGHVKSPHNGDSNVLHLMLEINLPESFDIKYLDFDFKTDINNWIRRFRELLFAFDYNIDTSIVEVRHDEGFEYHFFYYDVSNKNKLKMIGNKGAFMTMTFKNALCLEDFESVIIKASNNEKLSLELQILRESQNELVQENYRKSILDSATALEIALTKAIKNELKIQPELLNEILKMNNSISKKRNLLKYSKLELPNYNFKKDIEDLRNRAIHAGRNTLSDETRKAYKIVKETIKSLNLDKFE